MRYSNAELKQLKKDNLAFGKKLRSIPFEHLIDKDPKRIKVMRSRHYLVQIFDEGEGIFRLSINTTDVQGNGRFTDGISWNKLQELKDEAGFGDKFAVEIFPENSKVVNVANMRHLFILPERLECAW